MSFMPWGVCRTRRRGARGAGEGGPVDSTTVFRPTPAVREEPDTGQRVTDDHACSTRLGIGRADRQLESSPPCKWHGAWSTEFGSAVLGAFIGHCTLYLRTCTMGMAQHPARSTSQHRGSVRSTCIHPSNESPTVSSLAGKLGLAGWEVETRSENDMPALPRPPPPSTITPITGKLAPQLARLGDDARLTCVELEL